MLKLVALCLIGCSVQAAYYEESAAKWIGHINNKETTWKAGHNPYLSGMSREEMQLLMGAVVSEESYKRIPTKKEDRSSVYLPRSFVAGKDKWPKCRSTINFIKDQSGCGSCWAIAASSVIADRMCIANQGSIRQDPEFLNEKKPAVDMAVEDILACCGCGTCAGGDPTEAMHYWRDHGVVTGGWYGSNCGCEPYQISPLEKYGHPTPKCTRKCRRGYRKSFNLDKHKAIEVYRLPNNAQTIMQDIYEHGPVECVFSPSYGNFFHYKKGVYSTIGGNPGQGHAMTVIGWGEEKGTPYWLINNSFNATWGDHGQIKFLRGQNFLGIEDWCVAGRPKTGDRDINLKC